MRSGLDYRTSAWLRHLVNAYGVINLVRLIAAAYRRVWRLLAWLNPVVIPGLRAGTCAVLRGSLLIVCKCVCHLSNKELLYFYFTFLLPSSIFAFRTNLVLTGLLEK